MNELIDYTKLTEFKEYTFTKEQERIINHTDLCKKIISIQAYAGTGKSATMYHLIKKHPDKKILYLTFNTLLSAEMKSKLFFDSNVDVMTIHALALSHVKNDDMEVQENFTIDKIPDENIHTLLNISNDKIQDFKKCFATFCNSASKSSPDDKINIMWNNIIQNKILPHDVYLKMFQLSKPKLKYDIIILDEAQDITPCILSIIMNQTKATRIIIGDIHQQIYGFRDVCDPFKAIEHLTDYNFTLTHTFRFGSILSNFTSIFLELLMNETVAIKSSCTYDTRIYFQKHYCDLPKNTLLLSRTNKNIYTIIFEEFINKSSTIHVLGKTFKYDKESQIVKDFINILNNKHNLVIHKKLKFFQNMKDVRQHFIQAENKKWNNRIYLFDTYGYRLHELWLKLKNIIVENIHDADLILSTVHQTKGMQFDHVYICNDFVNFRFKMDGSVIPNFIDSESYNILYVAITRCRYSLFINEELLKFLQKYYRKESISIDEINNNLKINS